LHSSDVHAPVARPDRLASREPTTTIVHNQDRQMARERWDCGQWWWWALDLRGGRGARLAHGVGAVHGLDSEIGGYNLLPTSNFAVQTMHRTYSMRQSRAPTASQVERWWWWALDLRGGRGARLAHGVGAVHGLDSEIGGRKVEYVLQEKKKGKKKGPSLSSRHYCARHWKLVSFL
jgi:hypothetical protein